MHGLHNGNQAPYATGRVETYTDKARYVVFSDGSFRRDPKKLRGKAAVKRAKRSR